MGGDRGALSLLPSLLSGLVLAATLPPDAATEQPAGRWHFSYATPPGFRLSILFRRGETGDVTRLLLETPAGRMELTSTQGREGARSLERIVDAKTGEFLSREVYLPGVLRPAECGPIQAGDGCLVFEGPNGKAAAPLSGFVPTPEGDRLRGRVRSLTTKRWDKAISGAFPFFARSVEFDRYGDDFLFLVWPERRWKRTGRVEAGVRGPGCVFDAGFGYPCGEAEMRAEARRFPRAFLP
jgi:hypothetical protein